VQAHVVVGRAAEQVAEPDADADAGEDAQNTSPPWPPSAFATTSTPSSSSPPHQLPATPLRYQGAGVRRQIVHTLYTTPHVAKRRDDTEGTQDDGEDSDVLGVVRKRVRRRGREIERNWFVGRKESTVAVVGVRKGRKGKEEREEEDDNDWRRAVSEEYRRSVEM
jgi:hypothetical protein